MLAIFALLFVLFAVLMGVGRRYWRANAACTGSNGTRLAAAVILVSLLLVTAAEIVLVEMITDTSSCWIPTKSEIRFRGRETADMAECEGPLSRLERVSSYAFKSGQEIFDPYDEDEWDDEQVLSHLISYSSVLLVGDSLTAQLYAAFRSLLGVGEVVEAQYGRREAFESGKLVHLEKDLFLRPSHPLYAAMKIETDSERVKQPVISHMRSHHLLSNEKLEHTFELVGHRLSRVGYPWGDDPDWIDHVRSRLTEGPVLVVLNTGAHWSTVHFQALKGMNASDSVILQAYEIMAQKVLDLLPDDPLLHVVVKGMTPARINCTSDPVDPDLSNTDDNLFVFEGQKYNYHLFSTFNEIWQRELAKHVAQWHVETRIDFWDVWNVTMKRHDAYSRPSKGDCLHFCMPVSRTLVKMLLRAIMTE